MEGCITLRVSQSMALLLTPCHKFSAGLCKSFFSRIPMTGNIITGGQKTCKNVIYVHVEFLTFVNINFM